MNRKIVLCGLVLVHIASAEPGFTTTKIGPKPLWNATHTDRLRQDLLLNYDKFARPTQHYNTTRVSFGLVIRHVDFNEFKSSLTVHSWIKLAWNDDKLKWNTSDYGGLDSLHLADHEIWQPDLFVYNSATSTAINHYGNTHAIVSSDGQIILVPPVQVTVLCSLNLRFWPFDTQHCRLQFGSWTYNGEQVDLQLWQDPNNNTKAVETELLVQSTEWNILELKSERNLKFYACCEHAYPDITVNMTLSRVSPSYQAIIVTPAFAIILMILMTFWLPPQAGEKIILQGFTAIIICLFLLYFTQKLPAMGTHTPLIVLFFSSSLYVVCFALIGSVIVIWVSRTRHTYSLPWVLKQPLIGCLGKWLGLGHYIAQSKMNTHRVTAEEMRDSQAPEMEENNTNDDHHQMIGGGSKGALQQDWVLFAAAVDRLSFLFYSLLFGILAVSYSL